MSETGGGMKTAVAILAGSALIAGAGIGVAAPHWISGASLRPGSVPERALAPALRAKIDARVRIVRYPSSVSPVAPVAPVDPSVPVVSGSGAGVTERGASYDVPANMALAAFRIPVMCPPHTTVISGGYRLGFLGLPTTQIPQVVQNGPAFWGDTNGWEVDVRNYTPQTVTVYAYAFCENSA